MSTLADLSSDFLINERPAGNILDEPSVQAQLIAATRFYAGYTRLSSNEWALPVPDVSIYTEISYSEWAIIRPLFLAYVERETALQLEASRGLGMDVYGRSSSEVAADIAQLEAEIPHRAFFMPIITV